MPGRLRVLNFDNSLLKQKELLKEFNPVIADLIKIGPLARLWSDKKTAALIKDYFNPQERNSITLLGSGDFHHISKLLIEQFLESLTVIVFDHHPDWDILPPRLGCGSWVTSILRRENIKKVILFGVSSDDISSPSIQAGNLGALKDDRAEIYPYAHKPTTAFFKNMPDKCACARLTGNFLLRKIYWRSLKDMDAKNLFSELLNRINTRQVYVSIDKDCLKAKYSLTNWEEGLLELDELIVFLKLIRDNFEVVGADITGEYSLPKIKGKLKGFFSRLDHPADFSAKNQPESVINSVNAATNIKIIHTLLGF